MPNIKGIVLDLDGTLLLPDGTISDRNKECIFEQKAKGVQVFLATGRPISTASPIHQKLELNTPLICLNGAVIYDQINQKVLFQTAIDWKLVDYVKKLVEGNVKAFICQTYQANYQLINLIGSQIEEYWPVEKEGILPGAEEPIIKLKILFNSEEFASKIVHQINPYLEVSNWGDWFEVTYKDVTKWKAVSLILKEFGISDRHVIAFGDGPNDMELIRNVGIGVAMGNAVANLKEISDYITLTNEEDGIYHFFTNLQNLIVK